VTVPTERGGLQKSAEREEVMGAERVGARAVRKEQSDGGGAGGKEEIRSQRVLWQPKDAGLKQQNCEDEIESGREKNQRKNQGKGDTNMFLSKNN